MLTRLFFLVYMLLMITACSSIETNVSYDSSTNFSTLKTYMWLDDSTKRYDNPALNSDILKARIYKSSRQ